MEKTKIDWADSSWNPVTGCYHGCEYCYARSMAKRFSLAWADLESNKSRKPLIVLNEPYIGENGKRQPYPYGFLPTFHRYRLDDYKNKKGRTIFVCSMADLFGDWIPDDWIQEVFDACAAAPQHRYLFLTKNPDRYNDLARKGMLPQEHWYGYTATNQNMLWTFHHADECLVKNLFVSIEPILELMHPGFCSHTPADWVIIGAETGQRANKIVPRREWIDVISQECLYGGRPIFMKESLKEIMGEDFRQEFPWKLQTEAGFKRGIEPCPKCGSENIIVGSRRIGNRFVCGTEHYVMCKECCLKESAMFEKNAILNWNQKARLKKIGVTL